MDNSPILRTADAQDPQIRARLLNLRNAALAVDGQSAFNDQALADLAAGRRSLLVVEDAPGVSPSTDAGLLGAAILGQGELEFTITPSHRRRGLGAKLLEQALAEHGAAENGAADDGAAEKSAVANSAVANSAVANNAAANSTDDNSGDLLAWSHGDHPGARVLAARTRFFPVRTLLQLRRSESAEQLAPTSPDPSITTFRVGTDESAWLQLNSLAFAHHPEQGRLTLADLENRMAEPWFSAKNFLVMHNADGDLVGFNWLKVEPENPQTGEIYAIGVHPGSAGKGIGRRLMNAGLARLESIGATTTTLYVEADNVPAVALYRSLGFTDHTVDVQYLRTGA